MEKKWTDKELQIAFEDGCKFINFKDLQDFLLERMEKAITSERQLTIPDVIKSVCDLPKCVYCLDEGWVFPCNPCEHCNK